MIQKGKIIVIEDDQDDMEIFEAMVRDLGVENEIIWFSDSKSAYQYFKNTNDLIFVIFSDINLPGNDGIALKKQIDDDPSLRKKSIPFIFLTTTASKEIIDKAFTEMTVQGFFVKGNDYPKMKKMLSLIFEYWIESRHPNSI